MALFFKIFSSISNYIIFIYFLFILPADIAAQQLSFKDMHMRYPRFRVAVKEKTNVVSNIFQKSNMVYPPEKIFLRIFKEEQTIELWAKPEDINAYSFIKNYKFCSFSGVLGPKRREGDLQIPEGFYFINRFNPQSSHYLSLGINYPNKLDQEAGKKGALGGDIFIIGNCVSWGCIPTNQDNIKELYLIVVDTYSKNKTKAFVHIFPKKLNIENFINLKNQFEENQELVSFWKNLKTGYDFFETTHTLPVIEVDQKNIKYMYSPQ